MIDYVKAVTGPMERSGEDAKQRVPLTGRDSWTVIYRFNRSVRPDGSFEGCRLTDHVLRG